MSWIDRYDITESGLVSAEFSERDAELDIRPQVCVDISALMEKVLFEQGESSVRVEFVISGIDRFEFSIERDGDLYEDRLRGLVGANFDVKVEVPFSRFGTDISDWGSYITYRTGYDQRIRKDYERSLESMNERNRNE